MTGIRAAVMCSLAVFGMAFVTALAVSKFRGVDRRMTSDAFYYLSIAKNLARGEGYVLREGYWPETPTMSRSPGWPFVVSLVLRAVNPSNPDMAMRILCIALHAAGAALGCALAFRLFRGLLTALCAGVLLSVHPVGLYLADEGASEPLFVVLSVGGVLLILARKAGRYIGALLVGVSALVRPNLLLFAVTWPAAWWLISKRGAGAENGLFDKRNLKHVAGIVLCALLFLAPSFLWAWRNYRLTGKFPVLSSLQGQTFYGGNNTLTARPGQYWGYWVFPDSVPGEVSMRELADTRNEIEVSDYYMERGLKFLAENPTAWPALFLGKLIRAYVPIPWKWSIGSAGVSVFRWLLYALAAYGLMRLWSQTECGYRAIVVGLALSNVLAVLIFWGCARFAYPLDPFFAPFAGMMCVPVRRR